MSDHKGILLRGLDGSNPLAFLAALGTLRTLTLALPDEAVKMRWEQHDGAWRPRAECSVASDADLLGVLVDTLSNDPSVHPVMAWKAWMSKSAEEVRQQIEKAIGLSRREADYVTAIGSDAAPPGDDGIDDNPLRAARTDYFIKNLDAIITRTNKSHLYRALMQRWDYADAMENQSLRLDAIDDRRHAYQWSAPTLDKTRKTSGTMLGANRLAIEAYCYFQSCMVGTSLTTVAFGPTRNGRRSFRWPIWGACANCEIVHSLLASPLVHEHDTSDTILRDRRESGIVAVYEVQRIKVGDSNPRTNFTPARSV